MNSHNRCKFVMKLFHINLIFSLLFLLTISSCQNESEGSESSNKKYLENQDSNVTEQIPEDIDSVVVDSSLSGDDNAMGGIIYKKDKIILDNITFPKFPHPAIKQIMAGMKMCQLEQDTTVREELRLPPCDYKLYRAFKIKKDAPWTEGFILEVKASVYSMTRMVIVVRKVGGKYTAVNQFTGKLIELTLDGDVYNMLIGYADAGVGSIAIRHVFDGNKYVPKDVEEINNHFVKQEFKDSINEVYIDNFAWGY